MRTSAKVLGNLINLEKDNVITVITVKFLPQGSAAKIASPEVWAPKSRNSQTNAKLVVATAKRKVAASDRGETEAGQKGAR